MSVQVSRMLKLLVITIEAVGWEVVTSFMATTGTTKRAVKCRRDPLDFAIVDTCWG